MTREPSPCRAALISFCLCALLLWAPRDARGSFILSQTGECSATLTAKDANNNIPTPTYFGPLTVYITPESGCFVRSVMSGVTPYPAGSLVVPFTSPRMGSSTFLVELTRSPLSYTVTAKGVNAGASTITPTSTLVLPGESYEFQIFPAPDLMVAEPTIAPAAGSTCSATPPATGKLRTVGGYGYTVSNVRCDVSVTIPFIAAAQVTVTAANATISYGTSTLYSGQTIVVPAGSSPAFTVTPYAGYACSGVQSSSGDKECATDNRYTLTSVTGNATLTVLTGKGYTITASAPGGNGSISPKGSVPVTQGTSKTFTFTPASGYEVDSVTVDTVRQGSPSSYTFREIDGNHDISVTFRLVGATMKSYCNAPPFVSSGVKANLLLLIDNSSSMYDLAYTGKEFCVDDGYDDSSRYPGYFEEEVIYSYDMSADVFKSGTLPASCNGASTSYLCVNFVPGQRPMAVTTFAASGNFLNWLTTSKLDLEKKILTGGNFTYDTGLSSGILQGESRGCQGKRFVKMVKKDAQSYFDLTFAVRGPLPLDGNYVYQSHLGGPTRVEIYDTAYLKDKCQQVVTDWLTKDPFLPDTLQTLKDGIAACLGNPTSNSGVASKAQVYNLIMNDCYSFLKTKALPADPDLLKNCQTRYEVAYGADPAKLARNQLDDSICAAGLRHSMLSYSIGYIGSCLSGGHMQEEGAVCVEEQSKDFCNQIETPTVTDPAGTALSAEASNANLPSFILDAGVSALGSAARTFQVKLWRPTPPSGQIQAFSGELNIGAMVFNNGAGSECGKTDSDGKTIPCLAYCSNTPEGAAGSTATRVECFQDKDCDFGGSTGKCELQQKRDGGRVISHINHSVLGDHNGTGLIGALDGIRGTSWTPFAEAFYNAIGYFANRTDLRLFTDDFDEKLPPSQYSCQENHVLIITDGMSTADGNATVNGLARLYAKMLSESEPQGAPRATGHDDAKRCPAFGGSRSLDELTRLAAKTDITTLKIDGTSLAAEAPKKGSHSITTHAIYLGTPRAQTEDIGECDPVTLLRSAAQEGGGELKVAANPALLESTFKGMLHVIAGGSNAGSDASLLSTGEGNGALFLQPIFYTRKEFDAQTHAASWLGEVQALWYQVDPMLGGSDGSSSAIRDDTGYGGAGRDHFLDLAKNRIVEFSYNSEEDESVATLYADDDGDGAVDSPQPDGFPSTKRPEEVESIWRAGKELWQGDRSHRVLYTQVDGERLTDFTALDTTLTSHLTLLQAASKEQAREILDFVAGIDPPAAGTRDRRVTIGGASAVWKLGDIVGSTPKVQSHVSLNSYHLPPPKGYHDLSYRRFVTTAGYRKRGTVYVGANDGMLHAFRMGVLRDKPAGALLDSEGTVVRSAGPRWEVTQKGALGGGALGKEEWGFIPKNVLPYLKYLKDPLYSHLYYVDGGIALSDVSIGKGACTSTTYWECDKDFDKGTNWRTVLIGGMGLGGASRRADDPCVEGAAGSCVKAPLTDTGLSSYFALDVTGQEADDSSSPPKLLWEFADPGLGFATSGAAIVRINPGSQSKNGRWFAVFGSGPTGPIDCSTCQFKGSSSQNLKIFVVDLGATGTLQREKTYWEIDTKVPEAYAGSISGGAIDVDRWDGGNSGYYQDDAVYVGYTAKGENGGWQGGVLRVLTKNDPDPAHWSVSTLIKGIGPVTGGIAKLQDRNSKKLWLYFGTGRYSYNQDDMAAPRAIYGVQEPCYRGGVVAPNSIDSSCTELRTTSELSRKTSDPSDTLYVTGDKGWYIELDAESNPNGDFGSERSLTTPTASTAGAVFFSTFRPSFDPCFKGGLSYLWGVKFDTGGALAGTAAAANGKALTHLSTGSLASFNLNGGLGDRGGRRSTALTGRPGSVKIVSNSGLKPVRRILHMQER